MPEVISYAARANGERLVCLRIYADARGETHMQDVDMALLPRVLFKDNPPLRLSDTLAERALPEHRMHARGKPQLGQRGVGNDHGLATYCEHCCSLFAAACAAAINSQRTRTGCAGAPGCADIRRKFPT